MENQPERPPPQLCQFLLRHGCVDADGLARLLGEWQDSPVRIGFEGFLLERGILDAARLQRLRQDPAEGGGEALRRIGRYVCLRRLGSGGMGTVFLARHPELARPVAIKVLNLSATEDEGAMARFEREWRVLARIDHPNVVKIHDVDASDGTPFYVMDYYTRGSLAERGGGGGPVEAGRAVGWVLPLAGALDHCHQAGVVHRDVKPSNVLLDARDVPHLADFGLVWEPGGTAITRSDQKVGTPAFMSPEQAADRARAIDGRSDVYSLGTVLYWLLTGRTPFEADSMPALLEKVRLEEPPSPRGLVPSVPEDLDAIVRTAMAKDLDRRYPTAGDFARDLSRFASGESVKARPPGFLDRVRRTLVRRREAILIGVSAVTLACAALGVLAYREERRDAARARARAEARAWIDRERGEARATLERGEASLAGNRVRDAEELSRGVLAEYRENRLHARLGAILDVSGLERDQVGALLRDLESELDTSRVRGEAAHLLGKALARRMQFDEAARTLVQAIVEDPGSPIVPEALLDLGRLERERARPNRVEKILDTLDRLAPDSEAAREGYALRIEAAEARLDLGAAARLARLAGAAREGPAPMDAELLAEWSLLRKLSVRGDRMAAGDLLPGGGEEVVLFDAALDRLVVLTPNPGGSAPIRADLVGRDAGEGGIAIQDLDGDGRPEIVLDSPGPPARSTVFGVENGKLVERGLLERIEDGPLAEVGPPDLSPDLGRVRSRTSVRDGSGLTVALSIDRPAAGGTGRCLLILRRSEDGEVRRAEVSLDAGTLVPRDLAFADVDGDGRFELLVLAEEEGETSLLVLGSAFPPPAGEDEAPREALGPLDRVLALADLADLLGYVDEAGRLYGEVLERAGDRLETVARARLGHARALRLRGDPGRAASLLSGRVLDTGPPFPAGAVDELAAALAEAGDWAGLVEAMDRVLASGVASQAERRVWARNQARAAAYLVLSEPNDLLACPAELDLVEPCAIELALGRCSLHTLAVAPVAVVSAPLDDRGPVLARASFDGRALRPGDEVALTLRPASGDEEELLGVRATMVREEDGREHLAFTPIGWTRDADLSGNDVLARSGGSFAIHLLYLPRERLVHVRIESSSGPAPVLHEEFGEVPSPAGPGPLRAAIRARGRASEPRSVPLELLAFETRSSGPVADSERSERPEPERIFLAALAAGSPEESQEILGRADLAGLVLWGESRLAAMSPRARSLLLAHLSRRMTREPEEAAAEACRRLEEGEPLAALVLARLAQPVPAGAPSRVEALAELRLGLYEEAESELSRLLPAAESSSEILAARGLARAGLGRAEEAREDFLRAIELGVEEPWKGRILRAMRELR